MQPNFQQNFAGSRIFTDRSSDWINAGAMAKGKWDMEAVRAVAARGLVVQMNNGGSVDYAMHDAKDPLYQEHKAPSPRSKFGNKITEVDDIKFDSKAESQRYGELNMMLRGGLIHSFERQVSYDLEVNGVLICRYIADFVITWPDGIITVEDVKGVQTRDFKLKKKLMWAIHGIEIILVTSNINNNGNNKKSKGRRTRRH